MGTGTSGRGIGMMKRVLMTAPETAEYIRKPLATLYQLNHRNEGPRRMRVGRTVLYDRADVDAWLDSLVVGDAADGAS